MLTTRLHLSSTRMFTGALYSMDSTGECFLYIRTFVALDLMRRVKCRGYYRGSYWRLTRGTIIDYMYVGRRKDVTPNRAQIGSCRRYLGR